MATLHEWHWSVQAVAQQTPSTQRVLVHCGPIVQAAPCGRRLVHDPDWQLKPLAQSLFPAHVVRQTPPPHA